MEKRSVPGPSSETNTYRSLSCLRLRSAILWMRLGPVVSRLGRSIAETTAVCMMTKMASSDFNWSAVADQCCWPSMHRDLWSLRKRAYQVNATRPCAPWGTMSSPELKWYWVAITQTRWRLVKMWQLYGNPNRGSDNFPAYRARSEAKTTLTPLFDCSSYIFLHQGKQKKSSITCITLLSPLSHVSFPTQMIFDK
jgi:hypothetical protein